MNGEEICSVHGRVMEWMPNDDTYVFPFGGFWYCELCWIEEEDYFSSKDAHIPDDEVEDD